MNPTVEQAVAYFKDMANGKSVPIAPGRSKGLGASYTTPVYHTRYNQVPTNQALAQAHETVERQKVIRGHEGGHQKSKAKKKKPNDYQTPGLD